MKKHLILPKKIFSTANRLSIKKRIVLLVLILCVGSSPAWGTKTGAILHVDASASADGDGTSWETAFTDLQDALAAAVSGDEIWVAAGTYKPTNTGDRSVSFVLKSGVAIYGGFAGDEKQLQKRQVDPSHTVLSGDIGTSDDHTDNSFHVVYADGVSDAVLDGFTVTRGRGDGGYYAGAFAGAGMYTKDSALTVANCIFSHNQVAVTTTWVKGYGGGMYNLNSATIVTNCTFIDNQAGNAANRTDGSGGGMYNLGFFNDGGYDSLSPVITHCTFRENVASSRADYQNGGGGMCNFGSNVTVDSCIFELNSAGEGGGLFNFSPYSTISSCIFNANFNTSWPSYGGAILNIGQSAIVNCTFYQNGYHQPVPGFWQITTLGGAVYDGLYQNRSPGAAISNCIFSENADIGSGAVCSYARYFSPTTLTNCLFYKNKSWEGYGRPDNAVIMHVYGNVDVVNALYDIDPLLADPAGGDFHLLYDSPCIDAGYSLKRGYLPYPLPFGLLTTDFEGDQRIIDAEGDGVPAVDIGVDEFVPNLPDLGWFIQALADAGEIQQAVADHLLAYVDDAQAALDQEDQETAIRILNELIADAWASLDDAGTAQVIEMKTRALIEEID